MAGQGIRRKIDDLGRVVIPSQFRHELGIDEGDELEITLEADRVVIEAAVDQCTFCGAEDGLATFRDKPVCWSCMAALRALDRERVDEASSPFG
ncbi:MAG: AbrB/MazE/SpoVT family DNA-binding domain-containing protein [Egibacteraceae bacterium]